jgi:hypothetical protein
MKATTWNTQATKLAISLNIFKRVYPQAESFITNSLKFLVLGIFTSHKVSLENCAIAYTRVSKSLTVQLEYFYFVPTICSKQLLLVDIVAMHNI